MSSNDTRADDIELELYRCTECGKLSLSLGRLHGHIEAHRPIRHFWKSGRTRFLNERTEVITVTDYDTDRPQLRMNEGDS